GQHWRDGEALRVRWEVGGAAPGRFAQLNLVANFGTAPIDAPPLAGDLLYTSATDRDAGPTWRLAPGAVCLTLEENPLA
ncbi:MAG: DUF3459 domain-containing protein, partial [Variovorax sp.]